METDSDRNAVDDLKELSVYILNLTALVGHIGNWFSYCIIAAKRHHSDINIYNSCISIGTELSAGIVSSMELEVTSIIY
jgi:sRNA-binding regulator protein Hfq